MTDALAVGREHALCERIAELEARLYESEETLGAIRRGEIDALVVGGNADDRRIYTLENADGPYRVLIEQIQEGAATFTEDGTVLYCNQRLADLLGTAQERVIGRPLQPFISGGDGDLFEQILRYSRENRSRTEVMLRTADGSSVPVLLSLSPLEGNNGTMLLCGILTDLTQQKLRLGQLADANARLEREIAQRERVEEALRQSQKMEAVGQLTGGLAHDFNNLLTSIIGALELLTTRIGQGRLTGIERYVDAAQDASWRAATLTHRLLAFSRRQTLDPKPTSSDQLVAGMLDLVRRTVGPAIAVNMTVAEALWVTLCDPHQLESAILNLCINARDAMPEGGRICIEIMNAHLDDRAAGLRDMPGGDYVALSISDTGSGMPPDVLARAFDPFFTTKPIGKGTGLGLSMVYGFAKQSGGQVRIYSREGAGTTVCIYLPRHAAFVPVAALPVEPTDIPRAELGETVLVVDDEPAVRMLVTEVLEDLGYIALEAADGSAGLELLQSDVRIDLLVTDVGLPGGINGRQVADAARVFRPGLKTLFITGFVENDFTSNGQLEQGMHVLPKPFAMETLAKRIKDVITSQ